MDWNVGSARELDGDEVELVAYARRIVDAHGDGEAGIHTMGAAVRAADGRMYGGINLYHFTGGPCAELVALGHARASGARGLTTIVAVGDGGRGPVGPCGRDRQVLLDYHPGIRVLLPTAEGVRSVVIEDLMPYGARWTPEDGMDAVDAVDGEGQK
ncbi:cytidine deaminase [Streptomyces spiroverticillatus]|uniref:Cytidine deaminase n=1 Tax=Streptomyces finlayi TaxID=67296 RepID=A0A919C7T4_9ACTN|nr:cytidine deaminase [Streptomyces finlayi]GGZ98040.1 cytidine deaminase [Streptomyces spiroverticillatus]GHC83004.1 cytidine deaminase [Streptomyces finlayi]